VYPQTRFITILESISKFTPLRPPSLSPNLHDHGLLVHLKTRSFTVCKSISKLERLWLPSLNDLDRQLRPPAFMITTSEYIYKHHWRVYGNSGLMKVDRVMGSIYSADPGIDRHHLISISFHHTWKLHTLSCTTLGLTRTVGVLDPCNCVEHQRGVVSYRATRFLCSSNQNCSFL
jgi:hypothetical protein